MPQTTTMYLEAAEQIGRDLYRDAVWDGDRCTWSGWSVEPVGGDFKPCYRMMPANVYSGTCGIAWFLHFLHAQTKEAYVDELFRGALTHVRTALQKDLIPSHDYYSGKTGVAHTMIRLGELREDEALVRDGLALMEAFDLGAFHDTMLDLMSGPAGVIHALIEVGVNYEREALLDAAVACGEHLLTKAIETDLGMSWPGVMERKPLLGLSHGASGFALAFLELNAVRPDKRFRNAAMRALAYERAHFDATQGGWPDFRVDMTNPNAADTPPACPVAWCHGAGGIGLSRLRMLDLTPDQRELLTPEIDVAIQSVTRYLQTAMPQNAMDYSPCHGIFGNSEVLLEAGRRFNRSDLIGIAEQSAQIGIQQFAQRGLPWPCIAQAPGTTPNLMLGTAGIGYFLLRLHDPGIPSILIPQAVLKERS